MQNKTNKIILFALLGIALIASVITIIFAAKVTAARNVIVKENEYPEEFFFQVMTGSIAIDEVPDAIKEAAITARSANKIFNISSTVLYILVAIAIIAALVTFFKLWWTKRQSFIKTLLVAAILCVIFFVAWLFSSGTDVPTTMLEKFDMTQSGSKLVGAASISVYILFFASLVSIIVTEVIKLFKK